MPDREGFERPQLYCRNCGAQARPGNAFCVSCGERLNVERNTRPIVRGSDPRNRSLLDQGNTKVALYGAGVLLLLIVAYLVVSYSVLLGFLLIGLSVLAVLVVRRNRGRQTRFEKRVFEIAYRYEGTASCREPYCPGPIAPGPLRAVTLPNGQAPARLGRTKRNAGSQGYSAVKARVKAGRCHQHTCYKGLVKPALRILN